MMNKNGIKAFFLAICLAILITTISTPIFAFYYAYVAPDGTGYDIVSYYRDILGIWPIPDPGPYPAASYPPLGYGPPPGYFYDQGMPGWNQLGYQQSYNPYGYQQPFNLIGTPYGNDFGFSPFGYQQSYNPYGYQQAYNPYGYQPAYEWNQPYGGYGWNQPYNNYDYRPGFWPYNSGTFPWWDYPPYSSPGYYIYGFSGLDYDLFLKENVPGYKENVNM